MGSDGSEPFVIDPERARRPANPTPARALSAQREKRDAEISKIAARRAQKDRERERAAREAEEDAEAERLVFQQKMRAKREQLAAKAAAKGRGGQFASVASAERANEHLHPRREKYKPKGPPAHGVGAHVASSAARGGGRRASVAARGGGRRAPVAARGGGLGGPSDGGGLGGGCGRGRLRPPPRSPR
jgi:translation initiation factor 3 subunit A